ncbi:MAG: DUF4443 domain-containing protein [Candidatus Kariarchaeaceae archaeon]|jgi:hypothetical protein
MEKKTLIQSNFIGKNNNIGLRNFLGMRAKYTFPQLVLFFLFLDKSSYGRYTLAKHLDISLAKTRSILNLFVEKGLAKTSGQSSGRAGTRLSKGGRALAMKLREYMAIDLGQESYTISNKILPDAKHLVLILLKTKKVRSTGIYERDLAVRSGAKGAVTLIRKQDEWIFPDDKQHIVAEFQVSKHLGNHQYNTAILVFAEKIGFACEGAATVAYHHLEDEIHEILSSHFS